MDPNGIVPKVRHFVRSREDYTRKHVRSLSPEISHFELNKVQTFVEIAFLLKLIYKIINHLYLTAKKHNNYPLILPLQMILPICDGGSRSHEKRNSGYFTRTANW